LTFVTVSVALPTSFLLSRILVVLTGLCHRYLRHTNAAMQFIARPSSAD
jgi:hypothetical protein